MNNHEEPTQGWSTYALHLLYARQVHDDCPRKPKNRTRKWDSETPYALHPLWCATTIATETTLDRRTREDGFLALLYHDVLEDTTAHLPFSLTQRVRTLIEGMTFHGGSAEEEERLWERPKEIRLYKLYDKVSNLLDGSWMTPERRARYETHTRRLHNDVLENYGSLNITRIANAVLEGNHG